MSEAKKIWKHAVVTYNRGASYTVGRWRFERGTPKRCNDKRTVDKMRIIKGTGIHDVYEDTEPVTENKTKTVIKTTKTKVTNSDQNR